MKSYTSHTWLLSKLNGMIKLILTLKLDGKSSSFYSLMAKAILDLKFSGHLRCLLLIFIAQLLDAIEFSKFNKLNYEFLVKFIVDNFYNKYIIIYIHACNVRPSLIVCLWKCLLIINDQILKKYSPNGLSKPLWIWHDKIVISTLYMKLSIWLIHNMNMMRHKKKKEREKIHKPYLFSRFIYVYECVCMNMKNRRWTIGDTAFEKYLSI